MRIKDTFVLVSAYNNDLTWLNEYTDNHVIYNQGDPINNVHSVLRPHRGTDILDKFSWIVENYDNLPDIVMFIKGNLFKYISQEEFDVICNNKKFTPLLTRDHKTEMPIAYYENGIYNEVNNSWYVPQFPHKFFSNYDDFAKEMGLPKPEYLPFAPGSNYIVPKENILKRSKEFYEKLIKYLDYDSYTAEAQMCERSLYTIWL